MLDTYGINTGDGLTGKHYTTFTQVNDPITHVGKDDFYNNDYAAFFEDSWKASSKLTLNMGLRYDVSTIPQPPHAEHADVAHHAVYLYHPHPQGPVRTASRRRLADLAENRAAHRLRPVLRQDHQQHLLRHPRGERRVFSKRFTCAIAPNACPALTFPNVIWTPPGPTPAAPFAGALTPQVVTFTPPAATQVTRGMSPDWVNPRTHEGEVTLERALPGALSASVAYVVSRGLHLPIFLDANLAPSTTTKSYDILNSSGATTQTYTVPFYTTRINTNTGEVFIGTSDVNSWYNSMVLTVRRPMRHGLEFTANYTFSKAFDGAQVAGNFGTFNGTDYPIDPYNRKLEYGLSDLDQRQRFVANAVWMPSAKDLANQAARMILDGWAFSTIVTMSTGQPVTPYITGAPSPLDGGVSGGVSYAGANQRPRRLAGAQFVQRSRFPQRGLPDRPAVRARRTGEAVAHRRSLQPVQPHQCLQREHHRVLVYRGRFRRSAPATPTLVSFPTLPPRTCRPPATSNLLWGPRQLQISGRLTF